MAVSLQLQHFENTNDVSVVFILKHCSCKVNPSFHMNTLSVNFNLDCWYEHAKKVFNQCYINTLINFNLDCWCTNAGKVAC